MTTLELEEYIDAQVSSGKIVEFDESVFGGITEEQAKEVAAKYGSTTLMKLPPSEVAFFDWLKKNAPTIWADLWEEEGDEELPYIIGIGLLPDLCIADRGFPICDLQDNTNYHFSLGHIHSEEALPYVAAIEQKLEDEQEIDLAEAFMLEVRRAPIDVWRFSYMYRLPLKLVVDAVHQLLDDGLLLLQPIQDTIQAVKRAEEVEGLTQFFGNAMSVEDETGDIQVSEPEEED